MNSIYLVRFKLEVLQGLFDYLLLFLEMFCAADLRVYLRCGVGGIFVSVPSAMM